jgi:hypothetical protein
MLLPKIVLDVFAVAIQITLLVSCIFLLFKKPRHPIAYYLLATFLIEIIDKVLPYFPETNLYLFSISYYCNFLYLSYYYFKYILKIDKKIYISLLILGSLPMVLKIAFKDSLLNFEAYDWLIYDGWVVVLALIAIFKLLQKTTFNKNHLLISFSVLGFFGLDFSLAIATNYLVNGNPSLVFWIWALRAFILLLYFLTLSICTWKILKKA